MTMSDKSLPPGQTSRQTSTRRGWDLGAGDPAAVLVGARRALFVMVGVLAAYRGVAKFIGVTALVVITSGLAAWFTEGSRTAGIGWQAHIGGLVGGVLAGWVLRERRAGAAGAEPAGNKAVGNNAAGNKAAGTSALPATRTRPGQVRPSEGGRGASGPNTGPRADLHKQLDDLGL
jgi:hypothetical protein